MCGLLYGPCRNVGTCGDLDRQFRLDPTRNPKLLPYLKEHEQQIREHLSGNVCRCTGYTGIVEAVQEAARLLREQGESPS